jgi:hypothetical protein
MEEEATADAPDTTPWGNGGSLGIADEARWRENCVDGTMGVWRVMAGVGLAVKSDELAFRANLSLIARPKGVSWPSDSRLDEVVDWELKKSMDHEYLEIQGSEMVAVEEDKCSKQR